MDGGHSPSPHNSTQPLVTSAEDHPTSAVHSEPQSQFITPHYLSQDAPYAALGNTQYEADITEHGARQTVRVEPTHESASIQEQRALNWIVPVKNGVPPEKRRTVGERLESTLVVAKAEQAKYARKAKWTALALNVAQFGQIVINALVTGLSAAPSNRHAQIGVSALGALGTIIASFIVRVRGTQEPERSTTHAQNLEKFIREVEAFILDEGFSSDRKWDPNINHFRIEFDNLQTAVHQAENGQPMSKSSVGGAGSKV